MAAYRYRRFKNWLNSPSRVPRYRKARYYLVEHLRNSPRPWERVQLIAEGKTDAGNYAVTSAKKMIEEFLRYETRGSKIAATNTQDTTEFGKITNDYSAIDERTLLLCALGVPI